ncbi:MAG: class I SAM-dependent methyltransferase, partial [Actinomycetota bacterium]|nr:class I SAM-dependent methyltransferase [Actinomycetota bacterium]
VQLSQTVSPEVMFEDYAYYSSFADTILQHARENAHRLITARELGPDSLVVEVASNDGYLLRNFAEKGIPVLGIDPARGPADAAEALGIPTLRAFFGPELAAQLRSEGRLADVVIANNVLAHVPDLNGFVAGIASVLKDDGVAVIEVPYARDLIEHREFDTIYHEHLCYFSVSALNDLFARHDLTLNEVEHYPIHGGSLRLYLGLKSEVGRSVRSYLQSEAEGGLLQHDYYRSFAAEVRDTQAALLELLRSLRAQGKRIAAYGAAAKGTVLLNSSGIGSELIDFVVDRNVHKQGLFMPGVHIPIHDPLGLVTEKPDYTLILSWNFKDEIIRQQEDYVRAGGRFIVPVPYPSIIEPLS